MNYVHDDKPRGWGRLEELVHNKAFIEKVDATARLSPLIQPKAIVELLKRYKLPSTYYDVLENFIVTRELQSDLVRPGISVISNNDRTLEPAEDPEEAYRLEQIGSGGVYLKLSHDTTLPELIRFINNHWGDMIKPRLKNDPKSKIGFIRYPERDRKIYEDYLNRKGLGLTVIDIAIKYDVTEKQIYRIKKRQEKLS